MRDKRLLTAELIKQLPPTYKFEEVYPQWWFNLRTDGGLRLTRMGYDAFCDLLQLEHYKYKLDPFVVNSKMVIALDRKLQMPYYIEYEKKMPTAIVFFGSKEAMMANLYGDLKKFLDNY